MTVEEIFGWIQTLLTALGVWGMLTGVLKAMMVVSASAMVFKILRG
jgi:hypothetical protein